MAKPEPRILVLLRRGLEMACFAFVISFVTVVSMAVIYRYVLNASLPWSEEFIRFSLFWCVVLGAILMTLDDGHLRIEALQSVLPEPLRKAFQIAAHLVTIGFCIALFYYGLDLVERTTSRSPALHFPMRYVYLAMVIGALGIGLAAVWRIVLILRGEAQWS
ncbi:TRAP transporter small permease [Afifella pfennigii]|uniref:TRAP transporter small permease n=1 Tax=Afifella pfennigii TaxID=209897 RepID=UPI00047D614A|nr:TRAP transporter small permease [Afifella pfennigii]